MCGKKFVCKEANCYVPFEPKKQCTCDHVCNLKKEIREAVSGLEVDANEVLLASYAEGVQKPKRYKYDLENRLFYNIGSGAFSGIFQGFPKQAAFQIASKPGDGHYLYKYEVVKKLPNGILNKLCVDNIIAKWQDVPIGPKQGKDDKPDRYYAALRSASVRVANDASDEPGKNEVMRYSSEPYEKSFGIKIELTVPSKNTRSHPASDMTKHLLDGVICAFHGEEGEETKKSVQKRFQKNGMNKDEIKKFFDKNSEQLNLFGNRNYLTKSSRWNPEDDRLQFGWIVVKCEGKAYKMSGSIYAW